MDILIKEAAAKRQEGSQRGKKQFRVGSRFVEVCGVVGRAKSVAGLSRLIIFLVLLGVGKKQETKFKKEDS